MYQYHKDGSVPYNGEIFVFGSNLAGIHGAGAARLAYNSFGAAWKNGYGMSGMSFAIPTKDENINTLPLIEIQRYVDLFKWYVMYNHEVENYCYFVTRIGCGLAGYQDSDIAPMFKGAIGNFSFPESWKEYLE